jgi:hypothetical protein
MKIEVRRSRKPMTTRALKAKKRWVYMMTLVIPAIKSGSFVIIPQYYKDRGSGF